MFVRVYLWDYFKCLYDVRGRVLQIDMMARVRVFVHQEGVQLISAAIAAKQADIFMTALTKIF